MKKEIEIKAHVSDPDKIRDRLKELYGDPEHIYKDDIYYKFKSSGKLVRLRDEGGITVITAKNKTLSGNTEVNDEIEFTVSDNEAFVRFLQLNEAESYIRKTKSGFKYLYGAGDKLITVELCEVTGLGWFIEIEKLVEINSADETSIEAARNDIYKVLSDSGIDETAIEKRFYTEMLLENRK